MKSSENYTHPGGREHLSSLSHFIGALLAVAALVLLIITASYHGTARNIVGFSLFGASLIFLYSTSSIYHFIKTPKAKAFFQHLDRSMIFVLIAGSYTALTLSLPNHAWGWSLFGVEWGLATIGIVTEFLNFKFKKYLTQILYLSMGWLAMIALPIILKSIPTIGIWLLIGGGALYTLGFVFFILDNYAPKHPWFSLHDVFHFLVIAGSFSHFWLFLKYTI